LIQRGTGEEDEAMIFNIRRMKNDYVFTLNMAEKDYGKILLVFFHVFKK